SARRTDNGGRSARGQLPRLGAAASRRSVFRADDVVTRNADAEQRLEGGAPRPIHAPPGRPAAGIGKRSDTEALPGHAARDDAGKMRQIGRHVERESVQGHPALNADADGCDLVLGAGALVRAPDPNADTILAPLAMHPEGRERADDPFL